MPYCTGIYRLQTVDCGLIENWKVPIAKHISAAYILNYHTAYINFSGKQGKETNIELRVFLSATIAIGFDHQDIIC